MEQDNKTFLSYEQIHLTVRELAARIEASGFKPDLMVAIGTGGFIPARILKTYLRKPILTVGISYYGEDNLPSDSPRTIQWIDEVETKLAGKRVLLVDEVDDSRLTLEYCLRELLRHRPREVAVAVLHNKNKMKRGRLPAQVRHYFAGQVLEDRWICYPLDAEDILRHEKIARRRPERRAKAGAASPVQAPGKNAPDNPLVLTKEQVNRLPLGCFTGEIILVDSPDKMEQALSLLAGERLLGFDTETRPSFRKGESHPLALLQLASQTRASLFRIHRAGIPRALKDLLEDERVVKVAQGLEDELKRLLSEQGVRGRGFVDLVPLTRKLKIQPHSIRGLAAHFLDLRIAKSAQTSNWESPRLSEKQLRYAATDAWVCRQVYLALQSRGLLCAEGP